jgi:hypothetical protein
LCVDISPLKEVCYKPSPAPPAMVPTTIALVLLHFIGMFWPTEGIGTKTFCIQYN